MNEDSTWTEAADERLRAYLRRDGYDIPAGMGTRRAACSVAAINLALTGELTDQVPRCMSTVIGHWIISTQDNLSDEVRNSAEWRDLLPLAAGTGRDELREMERARILREWAGRVLETVVANLQEGQELCSECLERTKECLQNERFSHHAPGLENLLNCGDNRGLSRRSLWKEADPAGALAKLVAV